MLPKYQYEHYYDEVCEFCENQMVTLDERCGEGGECTGCKRTICEDCREGQTCSECQETVCDGCIESCQFCDDVFFCGECLPEHEQNCTRMTRALRKLETLTESLEDKQRERVRLRQRWRELAQELEDISEQKDSAEEWVKELERRGFT